MMEFFYYTSEFIYIFAKACTTFRPACALPPYRTEKKHHTLTVSAALIPAVSDLLCSFYFKPVLFSRAAVLLHASIASFLAACLHPHCRKTAFQPLGSTVAP